MSNMQIDGVLAQIRALQSQVKVGAAQVAKPGAVAGPGAAGAPQGAGATSFANVLKQGLDRVNEAQSRASDLATKFERGVPGVELSQVMLESQKASVAFRATVEVRNRLVSAYQEIMNMPI
ncbi:MAG TPA: flagellar hook-basal body complex protein FliE [Steroidobacteraceae bacterium]|nr:flagellar hook-basal body complex protein FliE [Steroidobacteraceae bacterium]